MALNSKKQITFETLENLKKELAFLKKEKRREIAEKLRLAISFGDLKENAAYHEAKDEQAFLEGKIIELENIINNSSVVSLNANSTTVLVGSTLKILIDGEENEYKIVEAIESDPLNGKISLESPIGKNLLGKKKGEECRIEMPSGSIINIKILEIK
jgi:transcription elongation factor GreA